MSGCENRNRLEKIVIMQKIFLDGKGHSPNELMKRMNCSRHTLYRCIEMAKEDFGMAIQYDRTENLYTIASTDRMAMPMVWFTSSDIIALLALLEAFKDIPLGILDENQENDNLEKFRNKLKNFLLYDKGKSPLFLSKIKVIPHQFRNVSTEILTGVCKALNEKKRIKIRYIGRQTNEETTREISPIQIVRYRDKWYLDAHCHSENDLRIFSLDRILNVEETNNTYRNVTQKQLSDFVSRSYGIFSGQPVDTAILKFNNQIAKWVEGEVWHPDQKSSKERDGSYILEIPYSDKRELILDILRYGDGVKVLEPGELRNEVKKRLKKALKQYQKRE